ncbi:MAG: Ig-like domain-containing protein [Bdellovibrionota bacterium]
MKNLYGAIFLCLLLSACIPKSEFGLGVDEVLGPPVVTLSSSITTGETINDTYVVVTLTASENIVGLSTGDFTCTNCTVGTLTGSGASYSFRVTPTIDGSFDVELDASSISDASGNLNLLASNNLQWTSDTTDPDPVAGLSPFTGATLSSVDVDISGTCETDATLTIDGDITSTVTSTCVSGVFAESVTLDTIDADTFVSIVQEDAAGNISTPVVLTYKALTAYPTTIAASGSHGCSLMSDATIMCWGLNTSGQLGDNTIISKNIPTAVSTLSAATDVSVGSLHTCAVDSGIIYCWGDNTEGQLGNSSSASEIVPVAAIVNGTSSSLSTVSAGGAHTCAVSVANEVVCAGSNSDGQLGFAPIDTGTMSFETVDSDGIGTPLTGISKVVAGGLHTCALVSSDGSILCWGDNEFGQIGDGSGASSSEGDDSTLPVVVSDGTSGLLGMSDIAAKGNFTCSLESTPGGVWCWGENADGQLGDATLVDSPVAVQVSSLSDATAIATGLNHACAIKDDQTVVCWGDNSQGQLGDGTTTDSNVPVVVTGLTRAAAIEAGEFHTCALLEFGTVVCWGDNEFGQLGDATGGSSSDGDDSTSPVIVDY